MAVVSGSAFAEEPLYCVEWMQADGSQAIILPVMARANLRYELKLRWTNVVAAYNGYTVVGSHDLQKGVYYVPFTTANSRRWAYIYGPEETYMKCAGGTPDSNIEPGTKQIHLMQATMRNGEQSFYQDGTLFNNNGIGMVTGMEDLDIPLGLFGRYCRDAKGNLGFLANRNVQVVFYYLKIWDENDDLIFEGRPGLMEDGTYSLYDYVSKKSYFAEGEKVFTSGGGLRWNPELQLYEEEVEFEVSVGRGKGSCTIDPGKYEGERYLKHTSQTVTATPADGYHFLQWTGDIAGDKFNPVQELTLEKDLTKLVAHFAKDGDPTVLYAAPEAKGFGDGVDWDNAGSLVTVYERGTNSQGKCILKLKKGCYRPQKNMEVIDNMEIIGGYAGEDTDEEPDSENNQTILHGSANYQWSVDDFNKGTGVLIVDTEKGVFNPPPEGYPATTSWYPSGNGPDKFSFYKTSGSAKNVTIANLTFATSYAQVINFSSTEADGFLITNCTFGICGLYGNGSRSPTVQLGNSPGEIVDCKFIGGHIPLSFQGADRACDITARNCTFYKNHQSRRGLDGYESSGISFQGLVNATVDSCLFVSNVSVGGNVGVTGFNMTGTAADRRVVIRNSVFKDNFCEESGAGVGRITSGGGRLTIDGCQFVGNTGGTCFFKNSSTYVQAKNCYIAGNSCDCPTAGASTYKSSVFTAIAPARYSTEFVNCTVENNLVRGSTVGRSCHTMITQSDRPTNLAIVNCLFRNNDCFQSVDGADVRCDEIHWYINAYDGQNAAAFVNSIFTHTAADYVPLYYSNQFIYSNSYLQGLDLFGKTSGARGWIGDVLTDVEGAPGLAADYKYTAAGTPALGIAADSPIRKRGRKVWEGKDGNTYLYNEKYNKGAGAWQALHTNYDVANYYLTAEQVEEQGLSLDNPVLADALGMERRCKKVSPGPVDFPAPGLMLLVR